MHVVLRAAAPAEAAAEVMPVHLALRERNAGGFRQRRERSLEVLRRHPAFGLAGRQLHRRVHHLHAGMREEGRRVGRLDLLRRARDRRHGVAVAALAVVLGRRETVFEVLRDGRVGDLGVVAFVPLDLDGVERGLGVPPGVGDDRDRGVAHLHHFLDARHLRRLGVIEAHDLGAEHRRILDRGVEHARQLHVDGVDLRAVELVGGVEPLQRLAGDLPALRVLELDVLRVRRRHLGGRGRDLAVADGPLRGGMRDDAVRHGHFADRHLPLVGRGLQQHHARGGAALAHVFLRDADAARAAGAHLAPGALAGEIARRRDALGRDFLPVAFELFGDELGEAGERALAHFRARNADDAAVVRLDRDPDVHFAWRRPARRPRR